MGNGISLGKIFGISVNLDWSWLFIFLLVTWNLAASLFPSLHPDWGPGLNWFLGIVASILFFASVLAHELAHSLVAMGRGLPVRRITLFLFGGVSNIEKESDSPVTEFLVAIVGPLISIALGILFLTMGNATTGMLAFPGFRDPTDMLTSLSPLGTILFWLGPINIILGIFNMIPAFPLDGGRVLRSILWAITKNLRTATRWATWLAQLIAWAFIIAGISMFFGVRIPYFGTGFVSGLWLAFIGWFLNNAATQSYQQVVIQDMLEGIPVSRLMRPDAPSVSPDLTVSQLVDDYIMGTDERSFPVMEGDRLAGVVSLEDIRKVPRQDWDTTRVHQIMTPGDQVDVVTPREDISEAMELFNRRDIRQVPVMQDGHLVGMLRRGDIIRWLQLQSDLPANFRQGL